MKLENVLIPFYQVNNLNAICSEPMLVGKTGSLNPFLSGQQSKRTGSG